VTQGDEVLTGKIALAHVNEFPDYYTRLQRGSRLIRTQNRELSFRCIAYNAHRLTNLTLII